MSDQLTLQQIVEKAFNNALINPTIRRLESCSIVAGCAAVRMAADGNHYLAAQLEGVAEESRRQARELERVPMEVEA